MKLLQFLALLLGAIALAPAGAHVFSLSNKIHLAQADYFIVQSVYRGWARFGAVLIGNLIALVALAVVQRKQSRPFVLLLTSLGCQIAGLAVFFAFVFPANVATDNWTDVPAHWENLRTHWEYGHAANALLAFAGFCALALSVLLTREPKA
jgi:hypothetical protein